MSCTSYTRHLEMYQGEDKEIEHIVYDRRFSVDVLTAREDISAASLKMSVWPDLDGTGPETFNVTSPVEIVINPDQTGDNKGRATTTIPAAKTASVGVAKYYWQLARTAAGGNVVVVDSGTLKIKRRLP